MVKLLWMMEEPEAGGTALRDKWRSSHPCASVMLDIRWFDEQQPSLDGLCCTLPVSQGRVMAVVEKLVRSKANAVWVYQQTQKEEKKAIALDCWRKLKWGMEIGFSFSNQNPGCNW